MCRRLDELDLVVGFNIKRFDYRVLQPYTNVTLEGLPTLDILEEVHTFLGFRLSLNHLAEKHPGGEEDGERSVGPGTLRSTAAGRSWSPIAATTCSSLNASSSSGPITAT